MDLDSGERGPPVTGQVPGGRNQAAQTRGPRPRIARHALAAGVVAVYLLAAAVVVAAHQVVPVPQWLALHLLVLGAASNAVFVWSRHFTQALLHARPGSERAAQVRLAVLNVGTIAVLAGVTASWPPLAAAGAALVVTAVAAHVASLVAMARSGALGGQLGIVAWYYVAAGAALAAGGTLGGLLAAGWVQSPELGAALVLAHAHLNLLGWLGLAILGTQFTLWPTVLRTRMSADVARAARWVLAITVCGLAVTVGALLATPYFGLAHWLAAAGMTAYAAGAVWALVPAVREMRARPPRSAPAWALLAGSGWLLAAIAADAAGLAAGAGSAGRVLDHLLVPVVGAGVVGQILTGALTFLLPVTVGGGPAGNRRLTAILETGWRSRAVLGNAGVLALAVLPAHGAWRTASWAAVLAGFGSFPLLMAAALATARGSARQRALPLPVAAEAADGSPEPRDRQ